MHHSDLDRSPPIPWTHHGPWAPWRLALALAVLAGATLVTGCPDGTDDDSAGGDDDAADDDAADDDADDDDIWEDDDAGDDDAGDDDAGGDSCTATVGPPEMPIDLAGTCQPDAGMCDGGYDLTNPGGTCTGGMTCCIHTDQCETAMMGTCAVSGDECEGDPPPGGQFPPFGCPPNTPICCIGGPP